MSNMVIDHHRINLEAFPCKCGPLEMTFKNDLVVINGHSLKLTFRNHIFRLIG